MNRIIPIISIIVAALGLIYAALGLMMCAIGFPTPLLGFAVLVVMFTCPIIPFVSVIFNILFFKDKLCRIALIINAVGCVISIVTICLGASGLGG